MGQPIVSFPGYQSYCFMPTIKEVADLAGVSVGTVSHVITGSVPVTEPLRLKVQEAILALDYHPNHVARSLKTNKTRTLGIIVPDMTVSFFPQLIRGAEAAAREQNYSLIAVNSYESADRQKDLLSLLRSQRVEGVLLVISSGQTPLLQITKMLDAGIAMVCLDRIPDRLPVDTVSVENAGAADLGMTHLISMGYRRIALVTGPLALKNERRRLLGYQRALERAGIEKDERLIWPGNLRPDDIAAVCREHLSNPKTRPDAIFSTNGPTGLGVLRGIYDCGLRTPQDIGFLTFDELAVDEIFQPSITTVIQPAFEIGFRSSEILIGRIENRMSGKRPVNVRLPAVLRVRESSRLKFK